MVKSAIKERILWWGAVPALAAVLVLLAILQYRWSGQVSVATRAQMQANLHTSLMAFRQDLSRELGAACIEVRSAIGNSGKVTPVQFSEKFQHWRQTAPHPALISQIYLWSNSQPDHNRLTRLDPSDGRAETMEWPAGFEQLREHLQSLPPPMVRAPGTAPRRNLENQRNRLTQGNRGRFGDAFLPWMVDQSIPVLVSPLRRQNSGDNPRPPFTTWIIIALNRSVLEKEIFPELAQKYFSGASGMDYRVAVVEGNTETRHILYASASGFGESNTQQVDATLGLFGPPFRRDGTPGPGIEFFGQMGAPAAADRAPQPSTQPATPSDDRRAADRMVRIEPFRYSSDLGVWQVVVKHQRGSVEAVVSSLRWRHLMLSFGVLILLAVTMALVVISSQRASRLARLQMDFVAGVSHELRTPLAVISSAAENIVHGVVEDKQQIVRYGNSILKQSRQLAQLVEQVLFFASARQSPRPSVTQLVKISEVVDAALEGTASIIRNAGVTVERTVAAELPPVSADFSGLVQCLQNLITNAVKYGGESRWMAVRASVPKGVAREIELSVEDRGIGIGKDEIQQIFEPFYRSPAVAGSRIHGTGLGLPLARTMVESMGGRLTARSALGAGSTFTIYIPVADGARVTEAERAIADANRPAAGFSS